MKRGLKRQYAALAAIPLASFKNFPDEEGTETRENPRRTESRSRFKNFPDEEGTETISLITTSDGWAAASKTSPMKRGLKLRTDYWHRILALKLQKLPRCRG